MNARRDTLTLIQDSFTGREELIEKGFRGHRPFRELCNDYAQCLATLRHWEALPSPEAGRRVQEYSELRDELGREISNWLAELQQGLALPPGGAK